jgi:hypothetical protein
VAKRPQLPQRRQGIDALRRPHASFNCQSLQRLQLSEDRQILYPLDVFEFEPDEVLDLQQAGSVAPRAAPVPVAGKSLAERIDATHCRHLGGPTQELPASKIDSRCYLAENCGMSIDTAIPSHLLAQMQEAADRAVKGRRSRDELQEAFAEMNRLREALRSRIGTIDVAVELVRDAREQ